MNKEEIKEQIVRSRNCRVIVGLLIMLCFSD